MKSISNKWFFSIITLCITIVLLTTLFVKVDSVKHLNEQQITKSLEKNIGVIPVNIKSIDGIYSCEIWESNYEKFMIGLRNSFFELSKKENTNYELIIVNLNNANLEKGSEFVNGFALYTKDLYATDWSSVSTYSELKRICNIE